MRNDRVLECLGAALGFLLALVVVVVVKVVWVVLRPLVWDAPTITWTVEQDNEEQVTEDELREVFK